MQKLIIIRGNSGSGKSTVAKKVREKAKISKKIALVEQDYLRRFVLKEKENESEDNLELIKQTVTFALQRGYHVILEGILCSKKYKKLLEELIQSSNECYIYYLDISFKETLKRHRTKPNSHEFGKKEMKEWYKKRDVLNLSKEKIINEELSENKIVKRILAETKL